VIEHVIVRTDEHAVAGRGRTSISLPSPQLQRSRGSFERFSWRFRGAALTDDGDPGAREAIARGREVSAFYSRLHGDSVCGSPFQKIIVIAGTSARQGRGARPVRHGNVCPGGLPGLRQKIVER